jgi:hypothetical protein
MYDALVSPAALQPLTTTSKRRRCGAKSNCCARRPRSEEIMPSDIDDDPPISNAIADGWASFAETILPTVGGTALAQAHIAFHFVAMYVLQIAQQSP